MNITYLDIKEAILLMLEGKKMRRKGWRKECYLTFKNNRFIDEKGDERSPNSYPTTDWMEFDDSITFAEALEAMMKGERCLCDIYNNTFYCHDGKIKSVKSNTNYVLTKRGCESKWSII